MGEARRRKLLGLVEPRKKKEIRISSNSIKPSALFPSDFGMMLNILGGMNSISGRMRRK
jgi:hypothetical protein